MLQGEIEILEEDKHQVIKIDYDKKLPKYLHIDKHKGRQGH